MSYVIGVNRIGEDKKGNVYPGHTAVYDGLGKCISTQKNLVESVVTAKLNYLEQQELRKQLHFLEDQDNFDLC